MHDYSSLCQELKEKGYCAWPNFLTEDEIRGARRDIELLAAENSLTKAGIGRGQEHAKKAEIRGDWTYWFNDSESAEIRKALLEKTAAIKEALNRNLFLGIKTFEGHYAKYPAGTHYLRHSDVFKNTDARVVCLFFFFK